MTDYSELSDDEAKIEIMNRVGEKTYRETAGEIISPQDVLYYLDAYGDFSMAINLQPLPKDLPIAVHREIHELDVLNDWQGTVNESECPICNRTLYEFDWQYDWMYVDEYGDFHDYPEYLNDHAGYYWDATEEHRVMCQSCHEHQNETFSRWESSDGVWFFYGEEDKYSRFSYNSGVIRWDFMWEDSHKLRVTDLYNARPDPDSDLIRGHEIAAAFAKGGRDKHDMLETIGFREVDPRDVGVTVSGMKRSEKYAKEILDSWADIGYEQKRDGPTHPDVNFTYIIEDGRKAYVPTEDWETFIYELEDQVLFRANEVEKLKLHREMAVGEW